jgi:DNA anti-recombination protein RmuC
MLPTPLLEDEVARASNDDPNAKAVATELGNVFADQFTALAAHLQQGFSSLERTMTQAMRTKRKRKSSSSSSGSGSSNHSEQEATSIKEPKQEKKSTTDDLTEHEVEDLLNTQDGNKSAMHF